MVPPNTAIVNKGNTLKTVVPDFLYIIVKSISITTSQKS